jgi:hypothetical protein
MKNELLKGKVFRNNDEAVAAVALAVYNNRRPHMNIGMKTPAEAARLAGDRNMRWKSYRHKAIKSRKCLKTPYLPVPFRPPGNLNRKNTCYPERGYKLHKRNWVHKTKNIGKIPREYGFNGQKQLKSIWI